MMAWMRLANVLRTRTRVDWLWGLVIFLSAFLGFELLLMLLRIQGWMVAREEVLDGYADFGYFP